MSHVLAHCDECGEATENEVVYRDGLTQRRTLRCECGNMRSHNGAVKPA